MRSWSNASSLPSEGDSSRVWDTSLLQAVHLTSFHAAVSIGCAIAVTELLHPGYHDRAWASPRALVVAAVTMVLLFPLTLIDGSGFFDPHWPQMGAALVLAVAVVALARRLPRTWPALGTHASAKPLARRTALTLSAGFVLTYAAPPSGLPWPIAVLGAVVIPVVGVRAALRVLPSRRDRVGPVPYRWLATLTTRPVGSRTKKRRMPHTSSRGSRTIGVRCGAVRGTLLAHAAPDGCWVRFTRSSPWWKCRSPKSDMDLVTCRQGSKRVGLRFGA